MLGKIIILAVLGIFLGFLNSVFKKIHLREKLQQCLPSLFFRRLSYNLIVGLCFLSLVMVSFHYIPRLMEVEESALDAMMFLSQGFSRSEKTPSFVLLDIDKPTFKEWGGKHFTPRDKLTNLLDAAVKAKPRLVIMDVDLSQSTISDQDVDLSQSTISDQDKKLKEYLVVDYPKQCHENGQICPPIIFARVFEETSDNHTPRTGFLEEVVTESPHLHWASVQFFSLYDRKIRRWKLWESICTKDQQPGIVPSVELLARVLVKQEGTETDIQNALSSFRPNCSDSKILQISPHGIFKFGDFSISTIPQDIRQRIVYRIPYEDSDVLSILSASDVLKKDLSSPVNVAEEIKKKLSDKIVVIGSYYGDGDGNRLTPIGELPGSLIVINAIYTLLQYGTIEPVSNWVLLIIVVLFIFIVTTVHHLFSSPSLFAKSAKVVGETVSIGLLLISSAILFYYYGVWLNITLPLIMVQIYYFFKDVKAELGSKIDDRVAAK